MNIAYTINGEGMGHAARSSVIIDHLVSQGHQVNIFSEGNKPVAFLRSKFSSVAQITGLHMVYKKNKVKRLQTAVKAISNLAVIRRDLADMRKTLDVNRPDVVITDFDFHGEIVSRFFRVPLISIDNIQYITQAKYPVYPEDFIDYELSYAIAKMMVPRADYYFITTFFKEAKLKHAKKSKRIFFSPPLLREKIRNTKPKDGDHILVYQTSDSYLKLFNALSQSSEKFIVYNARPKNRIRNVVCRDFDEDVFIKDLSSAKAAIVNGGFNVITESLYFKKPVLSIPIKNHFEQKLNGMLIQQQGLGLMVKQITKTSLKEFVSRLDRYKKEITKLEFDDKDMFRRLDAILLKIDKTK